ncbi:MAG: hypothetical protein OS112_08425 [Methanoregula sp.]|nr:MAG: hypothetical protein OS112_08425 [Methanoregula sp.]
MTPELTVAAPVTIGKRVFFPLVREEIICSAHGAIVSRSPAALLFSDDDQWFFVPFDEGVLPDVVRDRLR